MSTDNKCRRCGQVFRNKKGLTRHVKDRHAAYYYGIRAVPVLLLTVVIISMLAYFGNIEPSSNTEGNTAGENVWDLPLPVVTGEGLTSEQIKLGDIGGKPILLEFMVSWCSHCQEMAPILDEVYREYGQSVIFLSVAGTWRGADADSTAEFIRKYKASWTHVLDEQGKVFRYFGVESTPTFIFFDSDGNMVNNVEGDMSKAELIGELNKLR